jgi:hypothetical protein
MVALAMMAFVKDNERKVSQLDESSAETVQKHL